MPSCAILPSPVNLAVDLSAEAGAIEALAVLIEEIAEDQEPDAEAPMPVPMP